MNSFQRSAECLNASADAAGCDEDGAARVRFCSRCYSRRSQSLPELARMISILTPMFPIPARSDPSPPKQVLEIPQQCDQDAVAMLCDRSVDTRCHPIPMRTSE